MELFRVARAPAPSAAETIFRRREHEPVARPRAKCDPAVRTGSGRFGVEAKPPCAPDDRAVAGGLSLFGIPLQLAGDIGADAVIGVFGDDTGLQQGFRRDKADADPWIGQLLERRSPRVVTVALANKTARIAWAVMARSEVYRAPVGTA